MHCCYEHVLYIQKHNWNKAVKCLYNFYRKRTLKFNFCFLLQFMYNFYKKKHWIFIFFPFNFTTKMLNVLKMIYPHNSFYFFYITWSQLFSKPSCSELLIQGSITDQYRVKLNGGLNMFYNQAKIYPKHSAIYQEKNVILTIHFKTKKIQIQLP